MGQWLRNKVQEWGMEQLVGQRRDTNGWIWGREAVGIKMCEHFMYFHSEFVIIKDDELAFPCLHPWTELRTGPVAHSCRWTLNLN